MARTRLLHAQQTVDEDVSGLSAHARLVWAFLPCHADRAGRLLDKPFPLKLAILPVDPVDMDALLAEIARTRLITRYEAGGQRFIQIRNFLRYQRPHRNEAASVIPPPPDHGPPMDSHGPPLDDHGPRGSDHGPPMDSHPSKQGVVGQRTTKVDSARADPDPDPVSGEISPPGRAGDPPEHPAAAPPPEPNSGSGATIHPLPSSPKLTGYDLLRIYGEIRADHVEGALPWDVPVSSDGKAETFAGRLSPEAVADVRPTMDLHFVELTGGEGKAGALEDPTFGFGCWCGGFTRLREKLHGKGPRESAKAAAKQPPWFDPENQPR